MRLGITIREESDKYFIKKRYLEYFRDFEVVLIYLYNITYACAQCDAFAIVGGEDVNPKLYDEYNHNSRGVNNEIDMLDLEVIKYAILNNKPILGICRGLQVINVYFGGSLKQNIFNHMNCYHKLLLVENYLDLPESCEVNSYHHQSIKKIGSNLKPIYYSIDGEIELVIGAKNPVIATQFHPEIDKNSGISELILRYFKELIHV